MEDALVHQRNLVVYWMTIVLILVVMEDALVQEERVSVQAEKSWVLILVVMEDALVQAMTELVCLLIKRLNPCCNGRCARTINQRRDLRNSRGLNPCCNGRCTRTGYLR